MIIKIHKNKVLGDLGFLVELINTRETPRKIVKQDKLVLLNLDLFMDKKNGKKKEREKIEIRQNNGRDHGQKSEINSMK